MSVTKPFALVLSLALVAAAAVSAQQAPLEGGQPAPGAALGPKNDQFDKLFARWKSLTAELRRLRDEYRTAAPNRQAEIEKEFNQRVEQRESMLPELVAAARDAFAEAPDANADAAELLGFAAGRRCLDDEYEGAYQLARELIEKGTSNSAVYAWGAVAAFVVGDFDAAEEYFKVADEGNALGVLMGMDKRFRPEIAYYKKIWPQEQKTRAAEARADDLPRVVFKTSKGDIELELFENEAPNTVANFVSLVEKGFYNGLTFHRVFPQFMAQGGCPDGTGTGGPGYQIPCECYRPDHRLHFRGSLSMAHAGRDTGGSQFFLTFIPTRHLDGKHTVFGRVIDGMDVLAKLQRRDPQAPDQPDPDKILEARVVRKRNHAYVPKKAGR